MAERKFITTSLNIKLVDPLLVNADIAVVGRGIRLVEEPLYV
ncbi:MAG: hypothetical protein ACRAVC_01685 [Trichormus sp.]